MNAKLTRLFLGIAAVGAVAACVVNLSFTYPKSGVVVAITDQTSVNQAIPIDLSTQAEVQAHKANVQDLTLDSLDATVTAVASGSGVTITGKMWLRPDGATDASKDVLVGALNAVPVSANSTVHLVGSPALDALVLSTIKGNGKATALIIGASTGTANFTLDLKLHLSMAYQP
jgi:FtsP/CotA-like multicopper oxidase with cupredoxin domain